MDGTVRKYEARDIPALKEIWQEAFGDDGALIEGFFELLPKVGTGFVCVLGEKPISMAYVLEGLSFNGKRCAYIYAVATKKEHRSRGFGEKTVKECAEYAKARGCEIISTSPAGQRLYDWYEKLLDVRAAAYCDEFTVNAADMEVSGPACEPISAGEYNRLREVLLSDTLHVSFPDGYIAIEDMICRVCGGGLYRLGKGIAACYMESCILKVRELIYPAASVDGTLSSLMKKHGASAAHVRMAGNSTPYVAAAPFNELENVWWGPVLD